MATSRSHIDAWGVATRFRDALGGQHVVDPGTLRAIHHAMGLSGPRPRRSNLPEARVLNERSLFRPGRHCEIRLEDGDHLRIAANDRVKLPLGIHARLSPGGELAEWLIVAPQTCPVEAIPPGWGWATQLYSLRSRDSWGMGDFADLRSFGKWSREKLGTGFVLVNPLGANWPTLPQENSPYSPNSRLFLDPLYLRIEEVPGAAGNERTSLRSWTQQGRELNRREFIDRDAIFGLKRPALEGLWKHFGGDPRFDRYRSERGALLRSFAIFNVIIEESRKGWRDWPVALRKPGNPAVARFGEEHRRRVEFHEWLQWLLDEQLAAATARVPLMLDLPVGVRRDGFDAWYWQDSLALETSVGAPPDTYNALGQNWGLPPPIPHQWRATGYDSWRQTLRAVLRHAKALRIDHVMGLSRLYWIPPGVSSAEGSFVYYPVNELLAILAIESQRAGAVVVGEDLGTVESAVRVELRKRCIHSYRLLWFEQHRPEKWPSRALGAITTHDLFTIAGIWNGSDLEAQERLGLKPNRAGTERILRSVMRVAGLSPQAPLHEAIVKLHEALRRAPCRYLVGTLEDALAIEERPNMPGTINEWPNWRRALPIPLESIRRQKLIREVARALQGKRTKRTQGRRSR